MDQALSDAVVSAASDIVNYIQLQPGALVNGLSALLIVTFVWLLSSLARVRTMQDRVRDLTARVADLEANLDLRTQEEQQPREEEIVARDRGAVLESIPVEEVQPAVPSPPVPVPSVAATPVREETAISRGLKKSRVGFLGRLAGLFSGKSTVDTSTLDDLEELLILSDVGARCASELVAEVKKAGDQLPQGVSSAELTDLLKSGIRRRLVPVAPEHEVYKPERAPFIVLVVGVNGVGKTTTVAKLATKYKQQGKKVLAVAADTFRAAAVEQLAEWSNRVGFTLVRGAENAKPSGVVFDGMVEAKQGGFDVVLIDTAGRLHTKSNLMQELEGVRNSIRKHFPDGPHQTILVLDGVSGQNALSQAREFNQAVPLSGIVVTKLDGTPKGGIIVAISQELALPVFFIGVGEKVDDLLTFNPDLFVDALFEEDVRLVTPEPEVVSRVSNQ